MVHHKLYEVIDYVRSMEIREFADLIEAIQDGGADPLFWDPVVEHADMICAYLESVRRRESAEQWRRVMDCDEVDEQDPATGEVIAGG